MDNKPEVKELKRKPAPNVVIAEDYADERLRIEEEFDTFSPEFKHMWQDGKASAETLANRTEEVVKVDDKPVKYMGDMLVRISRDRWNKMRARENEASERQVKKLFKGREREMRKVAEPKTASLSG